MISTEFNRKWELYRGSATNGLDVHNSHIVNYMDQVFVLLTTKYPNFKYRRIHTNYHWPELNWEGPSKKETNKIRDHIFDTFIKGK